MDKVNGSKTVRVPARKRTQSVKCSKSQSMYKVYEYIYKQEAGNISAAISTMERAAKKSAG